MQKPAARILLDTHCWLWMQTAPERLSAEARELVTDPDNELYLSAASAWEMAVKWRLGKLPLPEPPAQYVPRCMERHGVLGLPIQLHHALGVADLADHHRDPFDRLLIAQARLEGLALLTADPQLAAYDGVELIRT